MSGNGLDPFDHAVHTANNWLSDVAKAFGTDDRRFAYRALRAWLHALRDRLTLESVATFAAQLPGLLRGTYYDGWSPSKSPIKYGTDEYILRFAQDARIPGRDVPVAAATITNALADHLSPGQLAETLAQLPSDLRALITGSEVHRRPERQAMAKTGQGAPPADRMAHLENQVGTLTEAVRALARGLENGRMSGQDTGDVARAARLADEIIMAGAAGPMP
jgi:uncharacterized protein (DUF2267 family)